MTTPIGRTATALALFGALMVPGAAAQGIGMAAAMGVYRALTAEPFDAGAGVGAELMARWEARSGAVVGFGARFIAYGRADDDRVAAFLDARWAPQPGPAARIRPVAGARAGAYFGGGRGDGDGSPLFGLETAALGGVAIHAGRGVSVTVLGDLGVVLTSNDGGGARRLVPGLQVGVVLH